LEESLIEDGLAVIAADDRRSNVMLGEAAAMTRGEMPCVAASFLNSSSQRS
jgi:hypothetical protein